MRLATFGFVFARPQYHLRYESKTIDFSKQNYLSQDGVRAAFAKQGIRFETSSPFRRSAHRHREPRPKLESQDIRFENVVVTYGWHDEQLLQKVKTAVSSLH